MEQPLCPLCDRPLVKGPSVDLHHLTPKAFKGTEAVAMHRVCHRKIHSLFTLRELRDGYASIEALRAHPEIVRFVAWLRGKPPEFMSRHKPQKR
jgi:hypothetical protein